MTYVALGEMEIANGEVGTFDEDREVAARSPGRDISIYKVLGCDNSHLDKFLIYTDQVSTPHETTTKSIENHTSQSPPCSLPGTVLAPSFAIFSKTSWFKEFLEPTYAPFGSGGNATGGTEFA